MKTLKTLAVSAILLTTVATGCDDKNSMEPSQQLKAIPATFADQTSDFAFKFWKQHNAEEAASKNYFVSPLSLHIALGMLLNGTDTKTKEEIQKSLGVSGDLSATNGIYKDLIDGLPAADAKVTNTIANSVWYRNTFTAENAFLNTLKSSFNATVSPEDFTNPATVGKINNWASDNTNGKIKKVLDEITPDQVMFLMNALYFKGDWKKPFDSKNTMETDFMNLSGKKATVKMMNMTDKVKYAKRGTYHAIELPYGGGENYVMTVLMPLPTTSALTTDPVLNALSTSEWKALNEAMTEQKVIVGLPKFTLEYESKLNNVLSKLGMPTMFSDNADLSKISPPAGKLKVGFVKQNTFVAVDEKGTEAAAVTTIGVELTSAPIGMPEFIANRPFLFVISEKKSNTILFTGKIANM